MSWDDLQRQADRFRAERAPLREFTDQIKTTIHPITLVMPVWSEEDWGWDPSITLNKGPSPAEQDRQAVRLQNNLCDALARNGFWWDHHGWVHKA